MCFSAEASFGVAAILVPAGVYCTHSAIRKNKALLGLAVIPFAFGLQQCSEGLVWRGILEHDSEFARGAAFFYLFFALAFWPFWVPLCAFLAENNDLRKKALLGCFVLLGFAEGALLYVPLLLHPETMSFRVEHHSIFYDITQSDVVRVMDPIYWKVSYALIVGTPMLIAPMRGFILLGVALVVAALFCLVVYSYAFVSVWCFFASFLSLYLCVSFRQLPSRDSAEKTFNHGLHG